MSGFLIGTAGGLVLLGIILLGLWIVMSDSDDFFLRTIPHVLS